MDRWYSHTDSYDDVVVSSRIRLARNLADFDFEAKLSAEDAGRLVDTVRGLMNDIAGREGKRFFSCNIFKLNPVEKVALVENHAISPALIAKKQPTGIILAEDESLSIMINEEDHIRLQAITPGQSMREAYKAANRVDDFIDSCLHYAYSDKYGYLTSCMTNVGTGMRASYMLSLPALTMSGKIASIQQELGKFGVVIRGIYGEGTKSAGFMYQVSNQKTLGCSESDILENLDQITGQIVSLERQKRKEWLENARYEVEDKVYRSYGVLKYTKSIATKDAMMLLAQLKLGCDMGLIDIAGNGSDIHHLMMQIQPGNIQKINRRIMDNAERDRARARFLNVHIPEMRSSGAASREQPPRPEASK